MAKLGWRNVYRTSADGSPDDFLGTFKIVRAATYNPMQPAVIKG